jgi:hypothetical protein
MQINTTGINKNWHKMLKQMLGLGKNANSWYAIHGVIETVELCANRQDRADEKEVHSLESRQVAFCGRYPWLKLFPIMIQKLLQRQLQVAWKRYQNDTITREFSISLLDDNHKCHYKDFHTWALPCSHILET